MLETTIRHLLYLDLTRWVLVWLGLGRRESSAVHMGGLEGTGLVNVYDGEIWLDGCFCGVYLES